MKELFPKNFNGDIILRSTSTYLSPYEHIECLCHIYKDSDYGDIIMYNGLPDNEYSLILSFEI